VELPRSFLDSIAHLPGFSKEAFEELHRSGKQVTSVRINPFKPPRFQTNEKGESFPVINAVTADEAVPWSRYGYYLNTRPSFTFDPLFHAGCYYVQEASSMFVEQAFLQHTNRQQPLKVLDLSAAPGGKSTHILSLLNPESYIVSNDVIRSRAGILKDNIVKWGCSNVCVTNNDPKDFARLEHFFDVIVVDAPCSGSGLFRREPDAIDEWSLANVQLCSQRQQRILADVWPALKKEGLLIYSTCSYSAEEDEQIVDWLTNNFEAESCAIETAASWNITASGGGYRFWPDHLKGEGFFMACLRKQGGERHASHKIKNKPTLAGKSDIRVIERWMDPSTFQLIRKDNTIYAWPLDFVNDFSLLLQHLRFVYSGTIIGEMAREKLIPDHALAMSSLVRPSVERVECNVEEAIDYLKRKELRLSTRVNGWQLLNYEGNTLGWINVLPNRINNYYPKELRILKDG
jgi:16S rRNA C967 or C1407 C5-methylase (RsmB/RsmF family)/NOL1/NOP2/fmu family ribosome biogenesis protein